MESFLWNFCHLTSFKAFQNRGELTLYNFIVSPWTNGHQFSFTLALWFVATLFILEIFNVLFCKFTKLSQKPIFLFLVYMCLGLAGVYMSNLGMKQDGWLVVNRMLYFLPFFAFGYLYNKKLEIKDKLPSIIFLGIILFVQLIVILHYKCPITVTPSWCDFKGFNIFTPFLIGGLGIAFWLRISRIIVSVTYKSKIVNCIANNTFSIMIHEFLGFFIVNCCYAVLIKLHFVLPGFNWEIFKSDIFYKYCLGNVWQSLILYLIAGIVIPLIIVYAQQVIMDRGIKKIKKLSIRISAIMKFNLIDE